VISLISPLLFSCVPHKFLHLFISVILTTALPSQLKFQISVHFSSSPGSCEDQAVQQM